MSLWIINHICMRHVPQLCSHWYPCCLPVFHGTICWLLLGMMIMQPTCKMNAIFGTLFADFIPLSILWLTFIVSIWEILYCKAIYVQAYVCCKKVALTSNSHLDNIADIALVVCSLMLSCGWTSRENRTEWTEDMINSGSDVKIANPNWNKK